MKRIASNHINYYKQRASASAMGHSNSKEQLRQIKFKEIQNILKKYSVPEEYSLDIAYHRVALLLDFMELIDSSSNQLKNEISLAYLQRNGKPSIILFDYVLLEISSYYSKIYSMKQKGAKFPDLPDYWGTLKEYRNICPGHRDKNHELKSLADHVAIIERLESIGIPNVVEDFFKYHADIKKNSLMSVSP